MLLIDIGNSRVKWSRVRNGERTTQRNEPLRGSGLALFRRLTKTLPEQVEIRVVNVAGKAVETALRAATSAAGLHPPRLLRSVDRDASGLINGYHEPWRLGADRWAAMLGARQLTGGVRALCVVDAGTALTIDFVDAAGQHLGGYIVPGPDLAVQSLLSGTRGIRRRASGARPVADRPWPRSTLPAIEQGALEACAGAIVRGHAAARREIGPSMKLLLTGGAAPALLPLLPPAVRHVPDLVLAGLQAWDNRR
jgi:type III pantothenate kinase